MIFSRKLQIHKLLEEFVELWLEQDVGLTPVRLIEDREINTARIKY